MDSGNIFTKKCAAKLSDENGALNGGANRFETRG